MPEKKHGVHFYLRTGRINPSIRGFRKMQSYLENMERDLIEAQGGFNDLSPAREILIKSTVEAYGVILLASMYCKKEGILRPDMMKKGVLELQPVLGRQMISFLNTIKQNLMALGLDKIKSEKIMTPLEIAEEIDRESSLESVREAQN